VSDADRDGDGTANCLDECPEDPRKTEPGECGCGESDGDRDRDGVANCLDGCPDNPRLIAPGPNGCRMGRRPGVAIGIDEPEDARHRTRKSFLHGRGGS
jgi:hypothetical protein